MLWGEPIGKVILQLNVSELSFSENSPIFRHIDTSLELFSASITRVDFA